MAMPPFQQNLMQSSAFQKKKKGEEELGKPIFQAQGLTNQQAQTPFFQPSKKVEAPKDLKPPATLQPAAPITAAPQIQPQQMLQVPKSPQVNLGNILNPLTQPAETFNKPLAPNLEGLLGPVGERPPLLQPQPPSFSPSAQLPSLPPRPQAGGLPTRPDLGGILNPMLQREPIPKNEALVPSDAVREALRPSAQEMLKPVTISTGAAPTAGAGGTEGAPTTPSEISPGGAGSSGASRFINFERLLSANQPMASQMAERAVGEATSRGEKAAESIKNLGEQFQRDVAGGTNVVTNEGIGFTGNEGFDAYMQSLQGAPEERVGVLTPGAGGWATQGGISAAPGATMGVGPTVTLGEAQQRAERGYEGPSYSDFFASPQYTEAQKNAQKMQEAANAMKTQEGLEAFMNQLYGTTGGAGGSRLDAALARVAGGEKFKAPQERFKGLEKILQETAGTAQTAVQRAEEQSKAGQDYWKNLVAQKEQEMADYDLRQTHEWKMANDPEYARAFNARGGEVAGSMYDNPYTKKPNSGMTTTGTGSQILVGPYPDGSYKDENGRRVDANGLPY